MYTMLNRLFICIVGVNILMCQGVNAQQNTPTKSGGLEKIIVEKQMDHEYAGIQGIDAFVANALKIAYGEDSAVLKEGRVAGA